MRTRHVNMGRIMSHVDKVIAMQATLKERLKSTITRSRRDVFLRDDFSKIGGTYRQLSRVLKELQDEQVVIRAGYGLYIRPTVREVEQGLEKVQKRLGKRVRREVTIGGVTVHLGATSNAVNEQDRQDRRKLAMACRIVDLFPMLEIRQRSLGNIERWKKNGVWVSAFDEWCELLTRGTDREVFDVMTGLDEGANRLRQSAPYAGLLTQVEVEAI